MIRGPWFVAVWKAAVASMEAPDLVEPIHPVDGGDAWDLADAVRHGGAAYIALGVLIADGRHFGHRLLRGHSRPRQGDGSGAPAPQTPAVAIRTSKRTGMIVHAGHPRVGRVDGHARVGASGGMPERRRGGVSLTPLPKSVALDTRPMVPTSTI